MKIAQYLLDLLEVFSSAGFLKQVITPRIKKDITIILEKWFVSRVEQWKNLELIPPDLLQQLASSLSQEFLEYNPGKYILFQVSRGSKTQSKFLFAHATADLQSLIIYLSNEISPLEVYLLRNKRWFPALQALEAIVRHELTHIDQQNKAKAHGAESSWAAAYSSRLAGTKRPTSSHGPYFSRRSEISAFANEIVQQMKNRPDLIRYNHVDYTEMYASAVSKNPSAKNQLNKEIYLVMRADGYPNFIIKKKLAEMEKYARVDVAVL